MARFARAAVFIALIGGSGACHRNNGLVGGNGKLVVGAGSVDFGPVFLGATPQRSLRLTNSGDAQLRLALTLNGDPQFQIGTTETVLAAGGFFDLAVSLHADQLGAAAGTLLISGDDSANVPITAQIVPDLPCPNDNPCIAATFDPNQGTCSTAPVPDGTDCDDHDPCTTAKVCSSGVCKGALVDCNDHSVCSTDYCEKGVGCQNLDHSADCNGSNPCKIYFCDSASGCQSVDATDGTPCSASVPCIFANVCLSGQCTGLPIPDGTPCRSPINPCAEDAKCESGKCESPSADLLHPGDVLWKDVAIAYRDADGGLLYENPDAGGFGWRGVASIDDVGNLYLDDDSDDTLQELVSMDVCGKERWRVPFFSPASPLNGRHLIFGTLVFSTSADGTIVGQSNINGATLWKYDPSATLGPNGGALPSGSLWIADVALSNQGIFYYTGVWDIAGQNGNPPQEGRVIGGILRNGQSRFQMILPPIAAVHGPTQTFGYPLLVDENENIYTSEFNPDIGDYQIDSFDEIGNARWTLPVHAPQVGLLKSLSEEHGIFVEPNPLMAFDSHGTLLWSQGTLGFSNAAHSPVVASDGTTSVFGQVNGSQTLVAFNGADAGARWDFTIPNGQIPATSHVLDSAGRVYFVSGDFPPNDANVTINTTLYAVDDASGQMLLSAPLDPLLKVTTGVLGLTPAGSLVVSARQQLTGIFAGAPMAASPWPRFRGDNRNRSCPTPANTPILPP